MTRIQMKTQLKNSIFFLLILFAVACNPDAKQQKDLLVKPESSTAVIDSTAAIINSIINISATDFYKNQQPLPTDFRDVKIKYSIKPNKEVLYILCGEFTCQSKTDNAEWIHFTTIKNSAYEQWIGQNGISYCENAIEMPNKKSDLSAELKNKLIDLQKANR